MKKIVAANLSQRILSVCNETHYGNFEIGSTLSNHLCVFDKTSEFLANLEPTDDSLVLSDGEIIFPEILAFDINKCFCIYIFAGDSNEETFLNSLNITFQYSVKNLKYTRNQSHCSLRFELCKPHITSSTS